MGRIRRAGISGCRVRGQPQSQFDQVLRRESRIGVGEVRLVLAPFKMLLKTARVLPMWAIWRIHLGRSVAMRLALYQPDIPQNTGTILRLAACLGIPVDIIGPAGFDMSDRNLRRAGLDYLPHVELVRHLDWPSFRAGASGRIVLLTTRADRSYTDFAYELSDIILFGRESAGVPAAVHEAADARLRIPVRTGLRSLNIAVAAGMVLGEALRQTAAFPP